MKTLFIDTSFSDVSIAILNEDKIMNSINENIPMEHSKYATKYIKDILDKSNMDANEIDNIMVCVGPGSFTGVRIGVTIAKTYGYLINKYITPVSSLKELAISCEDNDQYIMSLINARHNNYYVGLYDKEYNNVIPETFMNKEEIIKLIDEYNPTLVSDSFDVILNNKINKVKLNISKIVKYYETEEKINYHLLVPNYLKEPQALENKND